MKQKIKFLLISLSLIISSNLAQAGEIGTINIDKISKESKAVADVKSKISKKQDEFQKEVNKKKDELEAEKKTLEEKKKSEKEIKDFQKKVEDFKSSVEKKQASLKKANAEAMAKIDVVVKEIVTEVAKEKGFSVIIPASQTAFSLENIDVSSEVISKLNNKISKVEVKFDK
jgi:outer membrane protein